MMGRSEDRMGEGVFSLIRSDLRAKAEWVYGDVTRRTVLKACLTDGTFAMVVYRLMQAAQRRGWTPLAAVCNKINVVFGRCVIGRRADFGPRFVLIHSHGVVINASVRGGANILLEHEVTIGAEKNEAPMLGDDIFIGAGAKIIGGVRVGSHVKIGANSVVVQDIPDHATAVGNPARVVHAEERQDDLRAGRLEDGRTI